MIRINLLPKEERVSTRTIAFPKAASLAPLAALVAVAAIVGVTAALEHAKVAALRSDVADLREEVRAIQPQVDRVKKLTAQREELERRLDVIRQLDEGRFLSVRVMDDMSREVPRYMWLTNVNQQGTAKVTVNGITFSNLIVADYMKRLERSPMFAGVDLSGTERGEIDGRKVVKFAISAALTPDELPSDFSAEAIPPVTGEEDN
jgi:type IV pilus assembly protein PilN